MINSYMALLRLSGNMRRDDMVKYLEDNNTVYGYLDQPEGVRWIISIKERHLGYTYVYEADQCNVSTGVGSAITGHQDDVRTIINRCKARLRKFSKPQDLTPLVCP